MNKWEDSFRKSPIDKDNTCHCASNQGLFIPNRQLSAVVALLLLLFFAIFMTGYFLGKKKIVEEFTQNVQQEAFADHIYTTVLATNCENQSSTVPELVTYSDDAHNMLAQSINHDDALVEDNDHHIINSLAHNERYYAQLIGFGTEKAAQLFIKKLAAKGIETELKKRTSKTAKGQVSYWYQVVTMAYADKNELSALVDKLAKEENIKDACIKVC